MVIIIGGGITGLSAAYELSRRHVPFVLLEAASRAGGLILTEHADGFTLDAGPDSILAQKPAAVQLCDELGLTSRLISTTLPRAAFVLENGRLYKLPSPSVLGIPIGVSAIARYDLLPWTARVRLALEPLVPQSPATDESVASFFRRRFGASTVDLIAAPLLGGIHAGDIERLSMPSLFPRLVEAEHKPGRVRRNLAVSRTTDPDGVFRSLRGGMGELVTAMVSRLPPGAVRLSAPATALQRTDTWWHVNAGGQTHRGAAVIVAAPAHVAATLLDPLDPQAAQICRHVPYVSTVSVALGWRRIDIPHPLQGSGFVVARRRARATPRISACTWVSSKWEGRAPEGHALLRAFIGGVQDPGAVDLADGELIETAIRDISSVVGVRASPVLTRVHRWKNAGAQHHVGHHARMAGLQARLTALPGLFVAGSGFDSIGIPDCVAHGRAVAATAANYARMGK